MDDRRMTRIAAVCLGVAMLWGCRVTETPSPFNILIVTLDTTRADRLGSYGYATAGTPHFDALAAEGSLFAQAYSVAPVTLVSHSSIFTGLYPPAHGVRDNGLFSLPTGVETLAEMVGRFGYQTGAVIASYPLVERFGLNQGFDSFDDHVTEVAEDYLGNRTADPSGTFFDARPADRVTESALSLLRQGFETEDPFLAWVHYWDAHHPHEPPEPFATQYRHDLYQGSISFVDHNFGTLVADLKRRGLWDRTIVVVVGDHGEGLGEHREDTHSMLAYNSTLHVPLIVRVPGLPGNRVIDHRVGTVDIVPTILELLGKNPVAPLQGRSLVPLLQGTDPGSATAQDHRTYYAEALSPRLSHGLGELRVLMSGDHKYIHGPRPELFDLSTDPHELTDLSAEEPELVTQMSSRLQSVMTALSRSSAADAVTELDAESRRRLEALGYVSASAEGGMVIERLDSSGVAPQDRVADNSLSSRVKALIAAGSHLSARESARDLLSRQPNNRFYLRLLLQTELLLGNTNAAHDLLLEMKDLSSPIEEYAFQTARALFSEGQRDEGRVLASRLVESTGSASAHYLLGEMYGELGDLDNERIHLEAAREQDPDHLPTLLSLAIDAGERGQLEAATAGFRDLVQRRPLNPRYRYNLAANLTRQQQYEEAITQLNRALDLRLNYCEALYLHSQLSLQLELEPRPVGPCRDHPIFSSSPTEGGAE